MATGYEIAQKRIRRAKEETAVGLDLSMLRLTAVPPEIAQLTKLQKLHLGNNELTAVPPEIAQLMQLQTLNLSYNELTAVPEWLVQMPKLEKLYIMDNPITQPPPELLGRALTGSSEDDIVDLAAVRRYYAQLAKEGEAYFYEAKLLLIGEGGAGKTSLARKLLDPAAALPAEKESTEGIDILHWQFPVSPDPDLTGLQNLSGLDYTANIWDFGGQSVYHATHQFFLSKRSVYILLADTRRQQTDFYDWLQMQEAFGEDSPIVLLKNQNRRHGNQCVIENLPHLQKRFPNLKEIVELDLGSVPAEKNWGVLIAHLQKYLLNLDHIGHSRPKTWVRMRRSLRNVKLDQISRRKFFAACRHYGINDEADALQLSEYLHHVGDILHFEADPILKQLVILNPTWALDAVYRVLDNEEIIAGRGQFSRQQLHALWDEAKYDGHRVQLLRLMQNFQLCYALDKDNFIAPQLLQSEAPAYAWEDDANDLQLRYKYPLFMPRGILSRAIVALHQQIEGGLVWRVGVVLRDRYARAELLELRGEGEIRIRVGSANKRDLLMQIVRALDELHNNFSAKLKYDKLIPCRCVACANMDNPHFFKLDILLGRLARNKPTIDCEHDPYAEMQIPHLIGDIIPQAKSGDNWVFVNGDYFKIGDVENVRGMAIGSGASGSVREFMSAK